MGNLNFGKSASLKMAILASIFFGLASESTAGPFGRFRGRSVTGNGNGGGVVGGFATAASAAAYMASIGRIGHFGGNPYSAEGVGMGSTADQAIRNCCFYGRRQIADQGVCQSASGWWFACNRYH
jgi:hypothetical protein